MVEVRQVDAARPLGPDGANTGGGGGGADKNNATPTMVRAGVAQFTHHLTLVS